MAQKYWINHKEMRDKNISIFDARGKRICWVREYLETDEGIEVKVLIPFWNDSDEPESCAANSKGGKLEPIEAKFLLTGGKIVKK